MTCVWARRFGDQVVLLVETDGEAWQQLLLLPLELAKFHQLGDGVMVAFGGYSVN